jgi:GNAT superfamily N-acetyltransferase
VIAEDVRRFAEDPGAWGSIPPESGLTRVLNDRYCALLGPVPTFTSISRLRLDPDTLAETVAEVRALVAEHGHREAMWWVGSSAAPADLGDRLRAHGLVPDERAGSEPHAASMVLVDEPPAAAGSIVARRIASLDDFRAASRVSAVAFETPPEEVDAWEAIAEERFAAERAGHTPRTYLAELDGEVVATARALFADDCPAVLMLGGAVVPAARGRGVYRALVRARWEDAVTAGTPALCTHAGAMSRPILEQLGFATVAEQELLLDPVTC